LSKILEVNDLKVYFHTNLGPVKAVDGISFSLESGERLGLVGESGSGKTTTALALMRLIKKPGIIENGKILVDQKDLLALNDTQMREARFSEISMIPQGAMNSLNPVMKIGEQLKDTLVAHRKYSGDQSLSKQQYRSIIDNLLTSVGLEKNVAKMFPHELSGGMKQRVTIAMGISLEPKVILADEPTSALDVVVQRHVMETLQNAQEKIGAGLILVGHDMGLMAQFVHRIGVMYAGKLVEIAPVKTIFKNPIHPYTKMLIRSLPKLDSHGRFFGIPGLPPALLNLSPGCTFCERVEDFSHVGEPVEWTMISKDHEVLMCGGCEKR